jgi:integrase/recombinase XerC
MTVTEAVAQFLIDLANEGRSPHTVAAYRRDLAAFISFAEKMEIDAVTPDLLTRFMATDGVQVRPCGKQRAKATINRYRVSLKALFAWGEARWVVDRNPTAILRCKRHRALPPEVLTEVEIQSLLAFEFTGKHAARDKAIITFLMTTGCRLGETVSLNVDDVSWDIGTVTLLHAKGGDPDRIPITGAALDAIRPLTSGTLAGHSLFRNASGNRLSTRQVQRIVWRRCVEAGITKRVTPHVLRHTFATRLYNQTGDIRLVQKALRHEHVTTTETYAQVDPRRLKNAVDALI